MAKEKIESMSTIRIIPKSKDIKEDIASLECELCYELSSDNQLIDRASSFLTHYDFLNSYNLIDYKEYRICFPGPKLWIKKIPPFPETKEELQKITELRKDNFFITFRISRNDGIEEYVPLLFDNIVITLNELGIKEFKQSYYPESLEKNIKSIKRREFYKRKGGYEKARIEILPPELREISLRESLINSYKDLEREPPQTSYLFELLKGYLSTLKYVYNEQCKKN